MQCKISLSLESMVIEDFNGFRWKYYNSLTLCPSGCIDRSELTGKIITETQCVGILDYYPNWVFKEDHKLNYWKDNSVVSTSCEDCVD